MGVVPTLTHVCAVVAWGSWTWARTIAAVLQENVATTGRQAWHVALIDADRRRGRIRDPDYALFVVGEREITRFEKAAGSDLTQGEADWVLVDCTVESLDAACQAVRGLPRWPLAWLPPWETIPQERVLQPLIHRVADRLQRMTSDPQLLWPGA